MISASQLGEALGLGRIADEEAQMILSDEFPAGSRWESGNRVTYSQPDQDDALDVQYDKHGRISGYLPGPGLTDALLAKLKEQVDAYLASEPGTIIHRALMFSAPGVEGYWRHKDEWQTLPVPPEAPRPKFLLGEHPFLIEYKLLVSPDSTATGVRSGRRVWELRLLMSLLLRERVTPPQAGSYRWVMLRDSSTDARRTEYASEGYLLDVPNKADDLSDPTGYSQIEVVSDEIYYGFRGVAERLDVPASFDDFFSRFDASDLPTRDKLLRAAYWLDAAHRTGETSMSLGYLAAINAVETLLPRPAADNCPTCGLNRAPGPTARFRDFIEKYAANEEVESRNELYRLRSTLVHGGGIHHLDKPHTWAITPGWASHMGLHLTALRVARTAVRAWFLSQDLENSEGQ